MTIVNPTVDGFIRHSLTIAAGWLTANGFDGGLDAAGVAAVLTGAVAIVWSVIEKNRKAEASRLP